MTILQKRVVLAGTPKDLECMIARMRTLSQVYDVSVVTNEESGMTFEQAKKARVRQ